MENPPFMDDVPIKNLQFISIHRRFPIAMFDCRPQSVIDNTTSKPAIGLSVPPLSQPCRCLLSSACARAAQGWLCFNSWGKWDVLQSTGGSSSGHFHRGQTKLLLIYWSPAKGLSFSAICGKTVKLQIQVAANRANFSKTDLLGHLTICAIHASKSGIWISANGTSPAKAASTEKSLTSDS